MKQKRKRKSKAKVSSGPRVLAYVRWSTADKQRHSESAQRRAIIKAFGEPDNWFVDAGVSGAAELHNRPALAELLTTIKRGDRVVIAKRDRLARDSYLSAWLSKESRVRHFGIESADGHGNGDTAEGRLMLTVIDAFAAFELELIRQRTKAALNAKRARGERVSGWLPYGYRLAKDGKKLIAVPGQQKVIKKIVRWHKSRWSLRKMRDKLNADRVKAPIAKKWNCVCIRNIVKRAEEGSAAYGGSSKRS